MKRWLTSSLLTTRIKQTNPFFFFFQKVWSLVVPNGMPKGARSSYIIKSNRFKFLFTFQRMEQIHPPLEHVAQY